jgi:hypothetical protein
MTTMFNKFDGGLPSGNLAFIIWYEMNFGCTMR